MLCASLRRTPTGPPGGHDTICVCQNGTTRAARPGRDRVTHHTPGFRQKGTREGASSRTVKRADDQTAAASQKQPDRAYLRGVSIDNVQKTRTSNADGLAAERSHATFPRAPKRHVAITPVAHSNLPSFNPTGITTARPLAQRDHRYRTIFEGAPRSETVQEEEKDVTRPRRERGRRRESGRQKDNPAGFTSTFPSEDGKRPITFHFIRSIVC